MNRQILTETSKPSAETPAAGQFSSNAQPEGQLAIDRPLSEALAGAFPQWDLLPATPFVRRVK